MFTSTQRGSNTSRDSRHTAKATPITCYPREERINQIEDFLGRVKMEKSKAVSMRQVAGALDMSPSSHLMGIMWDLVDANRLEASPVDYRPGIVSWKFTLTQGAYNAWLDRTYKG